MERENHMAGENESNPEQTGGEIGPKGPEPTETSDILKNFKISPQMRADFFEKYEDIFRNDTTDEQKDEYIKRMYFGQLPTSEKPLRKNHHYETIKNQFLQDVPVEWPNKKEQATEHIRNILEEIETALEDPDQQIQLDYKNALDILELLSRKEYDINYETGEIMTQKELSDQKDWANSMRLEIKARLKLHSAFMKYEGGSSVKDAAEAMGSLYGGWVNVPFGIKEETPGSEEGFYPFVEALQYYENHGHEFARHNSEVDRLVFGKKVQEYLVKLAKERGVPEESIPIKQYHWAQNMAERLFRSTGRAIMYDYLVINKGTDQEKMVGIDYDGPGRVEWAGARDGCDYPLSKTFRFRENLRSSSEWGLMRPNIHLIDGADIYAGDVWTRTVNEDAFNWAEGKKKRLEEVFKRRIDKDEKEQIIADLTNPKKDNPKTPEQAKEIIDKEYEVIEEPDLQKIEDKKEKAKVQAYYDADIYSDRNVKTNPDNAGELVKHIDFLSMTRRTVEKTDENGEKIIGKDGKPEKETYGIDFNKMGAPTPFSLWIARRLTGPEEAKGPLSANAEAFLRNPNFDSLAKLRDAFDYSKGNSWSVKENILKNYIRYARGELGNIEATGRPRLSDDEILAGVNKLTGLTDPSAPQFVQLPERISILSDFFNLKVSEGKVKSFRDEEEKYVQRNYSEFAGKDIEKELRGTKDFDALVNDRVNKKINSQLNGMIDRRIAAKFAGSFAGWFLWGTIKEALKQAFK